jgi:hypothetical protein
LVLRKSDEIKQMTTLTMITISGIYVRYLKFHLALLFSRFSIFWVIKNMRRFDRWAVSNDMTDVMTRKLISDLIRVGGSLFII